MGTCEKKKREMASKIMVVAFIQKMVHPSLLLYTTATMGIQ